MRIKNWFREFWRRAKAILTDIHGEINIPKEKSKCIAETILPDIISFKINAPPIALNTDSDENK